MEDWSIHQQYTHNAFKRYKLLLELRLKKYDRHCNTQLSY